MSEIGKKKLLIIEDDDDIRDLVIYALEAAGFESDGFELPALFLEYMGEEKKLPDLILLDIMLPEIDGIDILKTLRNDRRYKNVPVIMLTAKSNESDKVKGLNLGADDYVSKPFGVTELIARINAVLRRITNESEDSSVVFNNIALDYEKHIVVVDEEIITLTYTEFELLYYLMLNQNIVLSREKIMNAVWDYDYGGETRTVDMHIKSLRQKLGDAGKHITTVRNVGYKLGN